jgi:hypothetical protein
MPVCFKKLILITNFVYTALSATSPYYVCTSPGNRGFFSHMLTVLGFLDFLDQNKYNGKVYFNQGYYLDLRYGKNWWNYYFEPIEIGKFNSNIKRISGRRLSEMANETAKYMPRKRASYLYNRYIKLKPNLQKTIDDFINNNFKDCFLIGVHYRGTDKQGSESSKIDYHSAISLISEQINKLDKANRDKIVIFVATDEQAFLDLALDLLPNVFYQPGVRRSYDNKPVHLNMQDPYLEGAACVIDFILLSKSNLLIRTDSNLSLTAFLINPDLIDVKLNISCWGARQTAIK